MSLDASVQPVVCALSPTVMISVFEQNLLIFMILANIVITTTFKVVDEIVVGN